MGAKAVYNNQSLMIYITGADTDLLTSRPFLPVSLYMGKVPVPGAVVVVYIPNEFRHLITGQVEAERGAIAAVRSELLAAHPELAGAKSKRREERRKRAKRSTSADVPD